MGLLLSHTHLYDEKNSPQSAFYTDQFLQMPPQQKWVNSTALICQQIPLSPWSCVNIIMFSRNIQEV